MQCRGGRWDARVVTDTTRTHLQHKNHSPTTFLIRGQLKRLGLTPGAGRTTKMVRRMSISIARVLPLVDAPEEDGEESEGGDKTNKQQSKVNFADAKEGADGLKEEIARLKEALQGKDAEVEQQRAEVEQQRAENEQHKAELERKNAEVEQQKAEVEQHKAENEQLTNEVLTLRRRLVESGEDQNTADPGGSKEVDESRDAEVASAATKTKMN